MNSPSPELAAITARIMAAMLSGQGETVANFLATEDPLLFCGSALNEFWQGQALRDMYAAHVNEFPSCKIANEDIHAYAGTDTGWSLWTGDVTPATQDHQIPCRLTFVFVLEHGIWRVQHIHNSVAISNLDVLGYEHTAFEQRLEAAKSGFRLDQTEGLATVMFSDIENSSGLAQMIGDRAWAKRVSDHLDLVAGIIDEHGGQLVKSLGDGSMASFPSARAALCTARDIQCANVCDRSEPALTLRIGLHTGDVIQTQDDFFGTVVNKSARIAATARPGTIAVSDVCRAMIGRDGFFSFGNRSTVSLKGFEGTHVLFELEWST